MIGRVGCGRDGVWRGTGVVVCITYLRYMKGAIVRLMSLEGVETVVGKYIRRKSVTLGYCSWKEAVFVVVVGG